jgi:hypothetical protein
MSKKFLNNYSISEEIFDKVSNFIGKNTNKTKHQICSDIEEILDGVEDKNGFYKKGYERGYLDGFSEKEEKCCKNG